MKTLDDQIREAFEALDDSVPDGYHDTFPSRIDKMLEVQAMAPETPDKSRDKKSDAAASRAPSKKAAPAPRENTGLHDIKAMARTTKERISRRVTTQSDVEESLLVSSSSGLKAVVLPEPGKDQSKYESETEAQHARETEEEEEARGGFPLWIYGAVGAVAVAAVVFFVIRGRGGKEAEKTAALEPPAAAETPEPGAAPEEPIVAHLDPSAVENSDDVGAESEPATADSDSPEPTVSPISPEGEAAAGGAPAAATPAEPSDKAEPDNASDHGHRRHRPARSKDRETEAKKPAAKPKEESKPPPPPPADKSPTGARSLEDILDTEMGPVPGEKADKAKAEPKKKVPTKTELSSTDIRKGMRSVVGRVQSCYTQFKKPGTVKVSVTVSNDGSVSEAFAVGEFKGTPTGTCVATAVKSASFPAWDGRAKTFKYSYLLAD